jgi:primosomal protein N' (replication factor Y)
VGPNGLLTERLATLLRETVARGEQVILFLNRRGFSSFVLCRSCGHLPECNACSISLSHSRRQGTLRCHYCGHSEGVPAVCPSCHAGALEPVGFGTERVEEDVVTLLGPDVGVSRMDRDTAQGKGLHRILDEFRSGRTQVLVGTQMVAKGHDFPGVTLVGVLLADHGLKFPDFRASERTFQLVTQVAGRAGRGELPGRVLVQTYDPDHPSLKAAANHDVEAFLSEELPIRELRGYPPHAHLALVKVTDADAERAERVARGLVEHLAPLAERNQVWILGPAFAPIQRIKNKTRVQVLFKSADRNALHRVLTALDMHVDACHLAGTVALDVDPHSLL